MHAILKRGDAYTIPVRVTVAGEILHPDDIETAEFTLGRRVRVCYPGAAGYDPETGVFSVPLAQTDTFRLPPELPAALDVRVRFHGGNVMGLRRPIVLYMADAGSREVL